MKRRGSWLVVLGLVGLAACGSKSNPTFCDGATPCPAVDTVCDLAVNECVTDPELAACEDGDPSDCPNGAAFCTDGRCSGCTSALGCDGTTPICEVAAGECRACSGVTDCVENTDRPICADDGSCIACTAEVGCDGVTPVCNEGACRGCLADAECATICDEPTGRCAEPDEVLFFDAAAAPGSTTCTREAPCDTLEALPGALTGATSWAVVAPGTYPGLLPTLSLARPLTIEATGATFDNPRLSALILTEGELRLLGAHVLSVISCGEGTQRGVLELVDVEIESQFMGLELDNCDATLDRVVMRRTGGTSPSEMAVFINEGSDLVLRDGRVVGAGIDVRGSLVLERSRVEQAIGVGVKAYVGSTTIRNSTIIDSGSVGLELGTPSSTPVFPTLILESSMVAGSTTVGLALYKGTFEIRNSIIVENGDGGGVGGIDLRVAATGAFEFNTVAENTGRNIPCVDVPSVVCSVDPPVKCSSSHALTSSYVDDRGYAGIGATPTSGCVLNNSGMTNLCTPAFVDDDPATPLRDYHLGPATTCRGSADDSATLATDFDGDARPRGVGREIGADEIE